MQVGGLAVHYADEQHGDARLEALEREEARLHGGDRRSGSVRQGGGGAGAPERGRTLGAPVAVGLLHNVMSCALALLKSPG